MTQQYQFQAIPLELNTHLDNVAFVSATTPWKTFRFTGARGTNTNGKRVFVVNFEWPVPYFGLGGSPSKRDLELFHLDRYITDHTLATAKPPYESVEPGADPPDFSCSLDGRRLSVECTQFASEKRRAAQGLFERLRGAILVERRELFQNLRGCMIYVWFEGKDGKLDMPYRSADDQGISSLLKALSEYRPDPSVLQVPSAALPDRPPILPIASAPGCRFYAVEMVDAVPASEFFARTAFELGMAYTTHHDNQNLCDELRRIIKKHDKPGIDELIVTAGGPDARGLAYLSEHILCAFALEEPLNPPRLSFLSRVVLHLWQTGAIVQIAPEYAVIRGDIYPAGLSVASHRATI